MSSARVRNGELFHTHRRALFAVQGAVLLAAGLITLCCRIWGFALSFGAWGFGAFPFSPFSPGRQARREKRGPAHHL